MAPLLVLDGVSKHFGGLSAVDRVSFEVHQGEVLGLIGPNGAGKSTLINVISGVYRPNGGTIRFNGDDISHMASHRSTNKGLVRTFQRDVSFEHLTVSEHVYLACLRARRASYQGLFFGARSDRHKQKEARSETAELLELFRLAPFAASMPRTMPHGFQRWLSLAMALALKPSLLLLDEPLSGMNAGEIDTTLQLLRDVKRERALTILLIEHNMSAVMNFCDRIVVIHYGSKICEGTPAEVSQDPAVIEAYLGGSDAA